MKRIIWLFVLLGLGTSQAEEVYVAQIHGTI